MATKNDATEQQEEQQTPESTTVIETVADVKRTVFNGEQCMFIDEIGTRRPYTNTTPESRNYGKYYRTFSIGDKSFTIIDSHKFCKDFDKENVEELHVVPSETSERGWTYKGHKSITQTDKRAESVHKRETYRFASLQREKMLDPEDYV